EVMTIIEIPLKDIHLHPDRFYRRRIPKIQELAQSMGGPNGQLQPIWVDQDNYLIFGFRRLEAAKHLRWPTIKAIRLDLADPLAPIRGENEQRQDLTVEEKVELGKLIEAAEAVRARERQRAGASGNLPEGPKGEAREKAAEAVGLSRHTYEAAKKVVEQGTPELVGAVNDGTLSVSDAARVADQPTKVQNKAIDAVRSGE